MEIDGDLLSSGKAVASVHSLYVCMKSLVRSCQFDMVKGLMVSVELLMEWPWGWAWGEVTGRFTADHISDLRPQISIHLRI